MSHWAWDAPDHKGGTVVLAVECYGAVIVTIVDEDAGSGAGMMVSLAEFTAMAQSFLEHVNQRHPVAALSDGPQIRQPADTINNPAQQVMRHVIPQPKGEAR